VTVRGWQWWWEFRYGSLGVVTANELHLPVGRPVVFALEGPDVIHSFWIPQLGGKRDVVPGRLNRITLTPERAGEYWGQCAEFCGASHANMRLRVIVEEAPAFERWVAAQKSPPPEPSGAAAEGKAIYARSACVGCHTLRGVSAGTLGPDLTHFGGRALFGAGLWRTDVDNVVAWLKDPPRLKPGSKMPNLHLTDAEATALAVYLTSLK
jgi:cytochrome c oxidase subunit 2